MVAKVRSGSTWVSSDDPAFHVYMYKDNLWKEVPIARVWAINPATGQYAWMEVWNKYQAAPTGVKGTNATVSGGKLQWQAAESATDYQIVERVGTSTAVIRRYPSATTLDSAAVPGHHRPSAPTPSTTTRSSPDGCRPVGTAIYSAESAKATLFTGHAATLQAATNRVVTVQPSKTDTWSSDNLWGQTSGTVQQGYKPRSRPAMATVRWPTAPRTPSSPPSSTPSCPTARPSRLSTTSPSRTPRSPGSTASRPSAPGTRGSRPTPGTSDFRASARPRDTDFPGSKGNFAAPDTGDAKEDFRMLNPDDTSENKLLTWAREWVKKTPSTPDC